MDDDFTFEGIEGIEENLRGCIAEVAYVAIDEHGGHGFEQVNRLDLEALPHNSNESDRERRVGDVVRWARQVAVQNMAGDGTRKFRFRARTEKGLTQKFSARFICRDERKDEDVPALAMPKADFPESSQTVEGAASQSLQAVMAAVTKFIHIVLTERQQSGAMTIRLLDRTEKSLAKRDEAIEKLVEAHTTLKLGIVERQDAQTVAIEQVKQRGEVFKKFVDTAEQFGNIWMQAQGIPPEMREILTTLASDPKIAEMLKNPAVINALKDPSARAVMGQFFGMMVDETKARESAGNPVPPKEGG